ncbi:MAG: T9SS type A sorting domain-containing protein, partial [Prevotella sp.]|nr:T9SS type A sorting domain-containing protein [Prevotella sp.]
SNGKTLFTKEDFWSTIVGIAQKSLVMSNRHASELYDLQGRSVQSGSRSAGNADLTGLPRGIYVVKSEEGTRKVAVK